MNKIIEFSIRHRLLVVAVGFFFLVAGIIFSAKIPLDVFPELERPTVVVITEAPGMAPDLVEPFVTLPVERAVIGAPGVENVRSTSRTGFSTINVEFGWKTNIYTDRQIVAEKLALAAAQLPPGITPVIGPVSSTMAEMLFLAVYSKTGQTTPTELRTLSDWTIRPRLMAIPGVATVLAAGGEEKQYQVLVDPHQLYAYRIGLDEMASAIQKSNAELPGGFLESPEQRLIIRNQGRIQSLDDIRNIVVAYRDGVPIEVWNLARVQTGSGPKIGTASYNMHPAVSMEVHKQPGVNSLALIDLVMQRIEEIKKSLPRDVQIKPFFNQGDFIKTALKNVEQGLRDGGILVAVVLFLFLFNFRITLITLTAIPLSFITSLFVIKSFGLTINTMTLGGMAVAIGELVDDAIVDVENIFRRLRENAGSSNPKPAFRVVLEASREVRSSIVFATLTIMLVFLPLLFLGGIEGKMFQPLGLAYLTSLFASLLVSLTITPALSMFLLPNSRGVRERTELEWVAALKKHYERMLRRVLKNPRSMLAGVGLLFCFSVGLSFFLGHEYFPPFNEGSYTINVLAKPGISLSESNRLGRLAEKLLLQIPDVKSVGRLTGRAEVDEEGEDVNYTEINAALYPAHRSKELLEDAIREKLSQIPGVSLIIGQPISHRLWDHLLSGMRAPITVKLFGPDLSVLWEKGNEMEQAMKRVPHTQDVNLEQQEMVPEIRIRADRYRSALLGLQTDTVNQTIETALYGSVVSKVIQGNIPLDLSLRYDTPYRDNLDEIRRTLVHLPGGGSVPVSTVADIQLSEGANLIRHDNTERRIAVECNYQGRDLAGVVQGIRKAVESSVKLPPGYYVRYEGQFQSLTASTHLVEWLTLAAVLGIFLLLLSHFQLARLALLIMLNLPLAVIGGVFALFLTREPLSLASLLGFITVFGIVTRNGIMMISHFLHLMRAEKESFSEEMVLRGSGERLIPILMTACTAAMGLIPIALAKGQPGKEILQPLAVVILGGLISSTVLNLLVTPSLFWWIGKPAWRMVQEEKEEFSW